MRYRFAVEFPRLVSFSDGKMSLKKYNDLEEATDYANAIRRRVYPEFEHLVVVKVSLEIYERSDWEVYDESVHLPMIKKDAKHG